MKQTAALTTLHKTTDCLMFDYQLWIHDYREPKTRKSSKSNEIETMNSKMSADQTKKTNMNKGQTNKTPERHAWSVRRDLAKG
jgi:hypothetical protein